MLCVVIIILLLFCTCLGFLVFNMCAVKMSVLLFDHLLLEIRHTHGKQLNDR